MLGRDAEDFPTSSRPLGRQKAEEVQVTLEGLKALASRPRFSILKQLGKRRMTSAELSTALGTPRGTIHSHVTELAAAGFVRRIKSENMWVYYDLTEAGRRIVNTPRPRLVLMLASSIVSLFGGGYAVLQYRHLKSQPGISVGTDNTRTPGSNGTGSDLLIDLAAGAEAWLALAIILSLLAVVLLATAAHVVRKYVTPPPAPDGLAP